jgi:hypothetical protein
MFSVLYSFLEHVWDWAPVCYLFLDLIVKCWNHVFYSVFFSEGTAKALPLFLLDEEKKNKEAAQFFKWKPGPKTTH